MPLKDDISVTDRFASYIGNLCADYLIDTSTDKHNNCNYENKNRYTNNSGR
jgi:hypothetical protein